MIFGIMILCAVKTDTDATGMKHANGTNRRRSQMKDCTGCKHSDERFSFSEPCINCTRFYTDKWEPIPLNMTVTEAIEFISASHVFSVLSAREKEALNVLIESAEYDPYQADMDEAWEQAKETE